MGEERGREGKYGKGEERGDMREGTREEIWERGREEERRRDMGDGKKRTYQIGDERGDMGERRKKDI